MGKTLLILAPHTDDGEIGCGATVARLIEEGWRAIYIAFSAAEESVPDGFPKDILRKEVKFATATLGIKEEDSITLQFKVRYFPRDRQEILEEMIKIKRLYNPDLVFLPCRQDNHQDHKVISEEGYRAFKNITILGYEAPWNTVAFNGNTYYKVTDLHLKKKVQALECYKSQYGRSYVNEEFIKSWAITRGGEIGNKYAEVFECIKNIK